MEKSSNTFLYAWNLWVEWNLLIYLSMLVFAVIGFVAWILISLGLGYVPPAEIDYLLRNPLSLVYVPPSLLIVCLLAGLVQWLAFKGRIKYSYLWIWATALGWSLVVVLLYLLLFYLREFGDNLAS